MRSAGLVSSSLIEPIFSSRASGTKVPKQAALFFLLFALGQVVDHQGDAMIDVVLAAQGAGDHLPIALPALQFKALRPDMLHLFAPDTLDRFS